MGSRDKKMTLKMDGVKKEPQNESQPTLLPYLGKGITITRKEEEAYLQYTFNNVPLVITEASVNMIRLKLQLMNKLEEKEQLLLRMKQQYIHYLKDRQNGTTSSGAKATVSTTNTALSVIKDDSGSIVSECRKKRTSLCSTPNSLAHSKKNQAFRDSHRTIKKNSCSSSSLHTVKHDPKASVDMTGPPNPHAESTSNTPYRDAEKNRMIEACEDSCLRESATSSHSSNTPNCEMKLRNKNGACKYLRGENQLKDVTETILASSKGNSHKGSPKINGCNAKAAPLHRPSFITKKYRSSLNNSENGRVRSKSLGNRRTLSPQRIPKAYKNGMGGRETDAQKVTTSQHITTDLGSDNEITRDNHEVLGHSPKPIVKLSLLETQELL